MVLGTVNDLALVFENEGGDDTADTTELVDVRRIPPTTDSDRNTKPFT